ncbi:LuxR C-terminal-related transcriptional regulator [Flavobacterium sp. RHBU_3]|uniref:LuxR C-terminal-related transcriptional regulator n=1 Tax=Flavobacterium sp. RHBU_3 TaxID=3391184 RepID=UPI003984659F
MDIYNEVRKIWDIIPTSQQAVNTELREVLYKKLVSIFQVGTNFNYIVNVRKPSIEYMSPEFTQVLGYDNVDVDLSFFISILHPEDAPFFVNFEAEAERFFSEKTNDELFNYKVQYDLRFKHLNGNYVRILHQYIIVQHDADNVLTLAVDTDITHLKSSGNPQLSFIGLNGAPSYYNLDIKRIAVQAVSMFTKREKEVLAALAEGLSSIAVAERLHISRHTVDVHRKSLLRKAEVHSTFDLIQKAQKNGWV